MSGYKISHIIFISVLCLQACRQKPAEISEGDLNESREKLVEINKILVKKDAEKIAALVNRRKWDMVETETGLWYMIYIKGEGAEAQAGMVATINYNISLLDGKECYSSDETGPKEFRIGQGGVVSGLEEGILLMHEGDKARFIMPPHLAYGLVGDNNKIPARAIICYEVELLKLDEK
ncbi:MAG: FKBP-type peptidyl-prolyl cis-trans isomerase [Bacteroidales bacterium]|nr:FKBP-type peptidyl-prolyl cis-trans isomerase [Bacteroidales bacterium]